MGGGGEGGVRNEQRREQRGGCGCECVVHSGVSYINYSCLTTPTPTGGFLPPTLVITLISPINTPLPAIYQTRFILIKPVLLRFAFTLSLSLAWSDILSLCRHVIKYVRFYDYINNIVHSIPWIFYEYNGYIKYIWIHMSVGICFVQSYIVLYFIVWAVRFKLSSLDIFTV